LELGGSSAWGRLVLGCFSIERRMNDVEFKLKNFGVILTFTEWKEGEDTVPTYELDLV
jgi:hypothetical protein